MTVTKKYSSKAFDEKGRPYTPDMYLKELVQCLERKKSVRRSSFHQGSFGIEKIDTDTRSVGLTGNRQMSSSDISGKITMGFVNRSNYDGSECCEEIQYKEAKRYNDLKKANETVGRSNPVPMDFAPAMKFEDLGGTKGDVNFLAVVHIDGNGMGARCNSFYESLQKKYLNSHKMDADEASRWNQFKEEVNGFSRGIDEAFKTALSNMFSHVGDSIKNGRLKELSLKQDKDTKKTYFPIRGIIASGDDICFVTDGRIGIECASLFLKELSKIKSSYDNKPFCASAGVAIVHQKYPFFRAYELAEGLCRNAKKFSSAIREKQKEKYRSTNAGELKSPIEIDDNGAGICAIDWHLEMGEIGMSVDEIRERYLTKDVGRHLEMRPYIVTAPVDIEGPASIIEVEPHRQYDNFRKQMELYLKAGKESSDSDEDVLAKLKELRGIVKKGDDEAQYYIRFHKLKGLIIDSYYGIFEPVHFRSDSDMLRLYVKTADGKERSILFDAAESLEIFSLM